MTVIEAVATALRDSDLKNGHCDTTTKISSYIEPAKAAVDAYHKWMHVTYPATGLQAKAAKGEER